MHQWWSRAFKALGRSGALDTFLMKTCKFDQSAGPNCFGAVDVYLTNVQHLRMDTASNFFEQCPGRLP